MRVGAIIPTFAASAPIDPAQLRRIARLAEDGGLDHLFVGDHLLWNVGILSPTVALAHLAAVTERIELGISVYLLPLRHPIIAAKEIASVDVVSGGRLILGVGAGGDDPLEYEALGVDLRGRGAQMEEGVTALRTLLSAEPSSLSGRFGEIPPVRLEPRPVRTPPIWMGGRAPQVVDRAARLADGWFPVWISPERYSSERERVLEVREPGDFTFALNLFTSIGATREAARAAVAQHMESAYRLDFASFEKYVAYGTAADILEFIDDYATAGVTDLVLNLVGPDPHEQLEALLTQVVKPLRLNRL
ncbi:MAG: LLM class flavin-dependent oxidoreductase [Hyphomicrobiales bacterium]|nr:MAG: LLM class flavin-dependent oxidoreductase [Hyphomicrobiales bacterium]